MPKTSFRRPPFRAARATASGLRSGKIDQFGHHRVEMAFHGADRRVGVVALERRDDRLVLARRSKPGAAGVHMNSRARSRLRARGLDRVLHPLEAEEVEQQLVHFQIELHGSGRRDRRRARASCSRRFRSSAASSAASARGAIARIASASSARRMNIAWRQSARSMRATRVPRCGSTSTKPSAASRPSASETGKRDTPSRAHSAALSIARAGRQFEPHDRVADHVLHALHRAAAPLARRGWGERRMDSCVSRPA